MKLIGKNTRHMVKGLNRAIAMQQVLLRSKGRDGKPRS
jgi:hypothetical protein